MKDKLYITFLPQQSPPPFVYQPETTAYLENADVAILNDGTVYFGSTAYEITGAEIWTALDTCVIAIKQAYGLTLGLNNLSTQFKYIYPRVGGTATAHRINLVDTATFVGTFYGGWTHDGSGALPNGTNGYMDTGCTFGSLNFTSADQTVGFISKTNSSGTYSDIGAITGGYSSLLIIPTGANFGTYLDDQALGSTADTNTAAHYSVSRISSIEYEQYKNGSPIGTITSNSAILATPAQNAEEIFEAVLNFGGFEIQYSDRKRTWHYAGLGSTDAEILDLHNALTNFETALNR